MIITTTELVQRAQLAADMHDGPFTPTQWMFRATTANIALSLFLARSGWTQNVKTQTITVTGSEAGAFNLTNEPLAIVAVHQVGTDGHVRRIKLNNAVDFLQQLPGTAPVIGNPREYRVIWDQDNDCYTLNFFPQPVTATTFVVSYIPAPKKLVLTTPGAGEANSVTYPLGYEEWIVLQLAIESRDTTEEDTDKLERRLTALKGQIEESVWDKALGGAAVRNVDEDERGWTKGFKYPPTGEWWFV